MKRELYQRALQGQKEFLAWMDEEDNKQKWSSCTAFAIVHKDRTNMCPETACFYSMGKGSGARAARFPKDAAPNGPGSIAFIVSLNLGYRGFDGDDGTCLSVSEADVAYLDWVMNRSPWSCAFVSKSAKQAFKRRSLIMDTTVPSNIMVGGGVAVRKLWETARIKDIWFDMVKEGVQEDLAYYLAASSQVETVGPKRISWRGYEPGHMNLSVECFDNLDLVEFLKHKPRNLNKPYAEDLSFQGYSKMFCENPVRNRPVLQVWIEENFPFKDVAAEQPAANPFAKAREALGGPARQTIEYDKGIKRWVDFQHVLFKEIGYNPLTDKGKANA